MSAREEFCCWFKWRPILLFITATEILQALVANMSEQNNAVFSWMYLGTGISSQIDTW